jgi:hypothetical protein
MERIKVEAGRLFYKRKMAGKLRKEVAFSV